MRAPARLLMTLLPVAILYSGAARAEEPAAPPAAPADGVERATRLFREATERANGGDLEGALSPLRESIALFEKTLGAEAAELGDPLYVLAMVLVELDRPADAEPHLRRSIAIDEKRQPAGDHGAAYNNLARLLVDLGRFDDAIVAYGKALASVERIRGPDDVNAGVVLQNLASAYLRAGRHGEAIEALRRALPILEKRLGREHAGVALTLKRLAECHRARGELDQARAAATDALAVMEKVGGLDHPRIPDYLLELAGVLQQQRAHELAVPLLERALDLQRARLGEEHPEVAQTLLGIAISQWQRLRFEEALAAAEPAFAIAARAYGADDPRMIGFHDMMASVLRLVGRVGEADGHARRAVAITEAAFGPDHPRLADSLVTLARVASAGGDHARARIALERALAIREREVGPDHPLLATILDELGKTLGFLGQLERARLVVEREVAILRRAGADPLALAGALDDLGHVLTSLGFHALARRRHAEALGILAGIDGVPATAIAQRLMGLGTLLDLTGESRAALPLLRHAQGLLEAELGPDHPEVATARLARARAATVVGELGEAREQLERALATTIATYGEAHFFVASQREDLADALLLGGDREGAAEQMRRAIESVRAWSRRSLSGATPFERIMVGRQARATLDHFLGLLAAGDAPGYEQALWFKGLAARAGEVDRRGLRAATGEARSLHEELREVQAARARMLHAGPGAPDRAEAWRARYGELGARADALALQLAELSEGYREASRRLDIGLADVQAALGEGEALVDFLRLRGRWVAFVVRREGPVRRVTLALRSDLDGAVERFRAAVLAADDADDAELRAAGEALAALVWRPVAPLLGEGARTVFVVPDAALATVPLAALPAGEPGRLLIDARTFVQLGTAQDLVPWRSGPPPGEGLLAVGAIDYGAPADGAKRSFEPLAAGAQEVAAIEALFAQAASDAKVATLRGADATETALRREARGRRFVHLATHGFVRADLGRELGGGARAGFGMTQQLGLVIDPMQRAGLALAGANARAPKEASALPAGGDADDDGILTAIEASGLDLDGTELVVLSACDGARGTAAAGDGVLGLVRGFRQAGARDVVASLWPVEDEATRRLMTDFYGRLLAADAGARGAGAALREASLALRDATVEVVDEEASLARGREVRVTRRPFAAPRHWLGFVAYGPGRGAGE